MKSHRSLLFIIVFLSIISFFQSNGMSYWQAVKTYFAPTPEQKLDKEFNDLQAKLKTIFSTKYADPLPIIKRLYVIGNIKHSDDWHNIIVEGFADALSEKSKTYYGAMFFKRVIVPTIGLITQNKSLNGRLIDTLIFYIKREASLPLDPRNFPSLPKDILIPYVEFLQINNFEFLDPQQAYPSILGYLLSYNSLLSNNKFQLAYDYFSVFYPQVDTTQKDHFKKEIIDFIINNPRVSWATKDLMDFIQLFLQPALIVEPTLYNEIFNAFTNKYFNKQYPQDFQLIFSQNSQTFIDKPSALYALIIIMSITFKDINQTKTELLKLYFDNLNNHYFSGYDSRIIIDFVGYDAFVEYFINKIHLINPRLIKEILHMLAIIERNLIERLSSLNATDSQKKAQFHKLFPRLSEQGQKISGIITDNIMLFNDDPDIAEFFSEYSSLLLKSINMSKMISIALAHMQDLSPSLAGALLNASHNTELARGIISANRFPEHITRFAKDILYGTELSPTMIHLKRNSGNKKFDIIYKPFTEDPEIKDMYALFRKKEKELNIQGYYTFVHGQMRHFYFPERLYTHLWSLRKKQPVDNFLFAHVKDLIETPEAQFEEDIMRRTLHMAGTVKDSENTSVRDIDVARRKKILFMNYAFFANLSNSGSNSASYVMENQNSPMGRGVQVSSQEPFTLLGYQSIYHKHKEEIEQLAKDYEALSDYGNMLLIAVPKDKIYKYVYLCKSGGLQKPLAKKDGTKITDIRIAMETLLNKPETLEDSDEIEFCLIMTQQKGGLDPSTGIQIYPLLSGDPAKLKALQEREKILLDKITADIKEQERKQQLERAAKIAGHVVESAQISEAQKQRALQRAAKVTGHVIGEQ